MASELRTISKRLYDVYQTEGIAEAARAVGQYTKNQAWKRPPEYVLNWIRSSTPIWEREWDICCLLDGCRYDTFEQVYDGDSSRTRSVASTSQTWIPRTFEAIDTSDVAYISANPYSNRVDSDEFAYFHLEPVEDTKYGIETVTPETLADRTIAVWRARDRWGVNKVVVHFMQPHVPFRNLPSVFNDFRETDTWGSHIWQRIDSDEIDRTQFLEAYRDNLEWVLREGVDAIKTNCTARIAVTADHGNATGEWGYYGHPRHAPISSIRTVPWAVIDGVDRETRSPDVVHEGDTVDIEKQLEALGYK